MEITYINSNDNIDFSQVRNLLAKEIPARNNWNEEKVKSAFLNSSFVVYAFDGEVIVGAARVLSDDYEWTLLSDLAVLDEYHNKGIGKSLLENVLNRYKGHEIFAYAYIDVLDFYEKSGFKRSKNAFSYSGLNGEALDNSIPEDEFYLPLGYKYETEFYDFAGDFPKGLKSSYVRSDLEIKYTDCIDGISFGQINVLLEKAFGGHERDINVTKGAFLNSQHYEFAFDGEKLIGCARAISDGVQQGFILNVAVDPDYQGLHLGWNVVSKLSEQMKGQNIFLNTHPGGVGFYNRKGFRRNKTALMFQAHPDMPQEIAVGFVLPKGYKFADEIKKKIDL